jgi:hypothetical protein
MSSRLAATLVLATLAIAWCGPRPAEASNMAFALERSFDLLLEPGTVRHYLSLYLVSFPLNSGLRDAAHSDHPDGDKCVGDVGGPVSGDGFIDANDAICEHWTSRFATFTFQKFDRDTCSYRSRTATLTPVAGIQFTGSFFYGGANPDPANLLTNAGGREIGYEVLIGASAMARAFTNRTVIVGSDDPSFRGRAIVAAPVATCSRSSPHLDILNVQPNTMYGTANEILCGLEGVDWVDAVPPIGDPDTCPNGTIPPNRGVPFDGQHALAVMAFDHDVSHGYVSRTVAINPITGRVSFTGRNFALTPGDAYILVMSPDHQPTTFLSPTF